MLYGIFHYVLVGFEFFVWPLKNSCILCVTSLLCPVTPTLRTFEENVSSVILVRKSCVWVSNFSSLKKLKNLYSFTGVDFLCYCSKLFIKLLEKKNKFSLRAIIVFLLDIMFSSKGILHFTFDELWLVRSYQLRKKVIIFEA